MIDQDNIKSTDSLTDHEIQYHIYRLFTALARKEEKIKQCEQILAMLNMAYFKYKK